MDEDLIRAWTHEMLTRREAQEDVKDIRHQFDISWFARLQKAFMTATGLNGNIVDRDGVSITQVMDEFAPKFCRMIHSVPEGYRRCDASDHRTTESSIRRKQVVVCKCHAGLYDSAVPIQFKQNGLGAFITGQVLLEPPTEDTVEEILRNVSDLGLDRDELLAAIREIPQITEEKLKGATEFMQILVDYIVKNLDEAEASRKEAEMRSLLRETEMKVIQSKLHPHFLFNILNLISGQALLENAAMTYATVNSLSRMLRFNIKSYRPLVTLNEELNILDAYIGLQLQRFEDRFSFGVQLADDALKQFLIPSLTLQLLIENAIKHGIEPKEGECRVDVRIGREEQRPGVTAGGGRIRIEIEDDGIGMSEDELRRLNDANGEATTELSGIGMIRKRLDYYFDGDFEFMFSSQESGGTLVCLSLPFRSG